MSGVAQSELYPGGVSGVRRRRICSAYAANDFAATANGATPLTDSSGSVGNVSLMSLGFASDGGQYLNGTIRRVTYWNTRLPNFYLQAITSP
jgi:hypothetical protein